MTKLLRISPGSNFYIQELVSPWWMNQASSPAHVLKGLRLNNPAMIEGLNLIRSTVDESVTVNNWHRGGSYSESGLRTPRIVPDVQQFSLFSTHYFFGSDDLKFKSVDTDEVYNMILRNPRKFHMITNMENVNATRSSRGKLGRDWLHVTFGYRTPDTKIRIINP